MLLSDVVATSTEVAATRSRLAKRAALARLLTAADPVDLEIVVSYLAGELRQRRTGVGWGSLRAVPPPARASSLSVVEVDAEFERIARLAGSGSAATRAAAVAGLFARATAEEQQFLRGLVSGDVRQGALDSSVLDAIAAASSVPLPAVRRAAMLRGATAPVAVAALRGGVEAVEAFGLTAGQPVRPMLASSAPDIGAAMQKAAGQGQAVCVDTKLDGIRIQVHKRGDEIRVFTRSLDEITTRLPEVVAATRRLPAETLILDGEAIALDETGRPRPFQETSARTAAALSDAAPPGTAVTPFFFDCLHIDGVDLIDLPLHDRLLRLDAVLSPGLGVPRVVTGEPGEGAAFFTAAVAAGQEGVVVKSLGSAYDAGRRGAAWVKVKPRHTLDLVVLAVEWGSGRRHGKLSNIHLGARDPVTGDFVMLGKTFKGMTDEMLGWQTERFLELETRRTSYAVHVRPEQVVEIAFDGLQRSTRYPGGVTLRFARVLRYRDDKSAAEADTIDTVRALVSPRV